MNKKLKQSIMNRVDEYQKAYLNAKDVQDECLYLGQLCALLDLVGDLKDEQMWKYINNIITSLL